MGTSTRLDDLTRRFRENLEKYRDGGLPGITALAKDYDVSYVTMWRALGRLEQEGLIDRRRGRRARLSGTDAPVGPLGPTVSERVYTKLKQAILRGTYRAGNALPKIDYHAFEYGVSRVTVRKALACLEKDALCFRYGKRFVVGKRPGSVPLTAASRQAPPVPVVLMMVDSWVAHNEFYTDPGTMSFMVSFVEELQRNGFGISLVHPDESVGRVFLLQGDCHSLLDIAARLGERYKGTVVLSSRAKLEKPNAWLSLLSSLGKPVVLYDNDQTESPTLLVPKSASARSRRLFYRVRQDESTAVRLALQELVSLGHQCIGIPNFITRYTKWVDRRIGIAREIFKRMAPNVTLVGMNDEQLCVRGWNTDTAKDAYGEISPRVDDSLRRILTHIFESDMPFDVRRDIIACLPCLAALTKQAGVTALLVPNDRLAVPIYRLCLYCGVNIPRDLSLVAFDNRFRVRHVPVTTVDFGLAGIGYAAAQAFVRSVPVPKDRHGAIISHPYVVHRGSLAPPAQSALHDRILSA